MGRDGFACDGQTIPTQTPEGGSELDHLSSSGHRPVYHGPEAEGNGIDAEAHCRGPAGCAITADGLRELTGFTPRMFALVREFVEADDSVTHVVAYGMSLPDGATTVHAGGGSIGRWVSAESAASRLGACLVWLGESAVR
ncbi:hypothetical protein AB0K60_34715 [Thermopolyspora sp. NPDC052614]|uniref:hypothetical protein n=1 Tax=Thermopolyspora sp. NPDC052614 TaxID=3155682 RepID=UPI0034283C22